MTQYKIDLTKLVASAEHDRLLKHFIELEVVKPLLAEYEINPTNALSNVLIQKFQTYYVYVLLTSYIQKNLYFKSIHLKQREQLRQKRLKYDDDSINNIPNGEESNKLKLTWENSIDNAELLMALDSLSAYQNRVLRYLYILGYSQKQVAQILQVSPQAVSKVRRSAMKKIKIVLEEGT